MVPQVAEGLRGRRIFFRCTPRACGFALLLGCAHAVLAQVPLTFVSEVDGSRQAYALYIPKTADSGKKHPLLISLHSEESNHRLNMKQVFGVSARYGELDPVNMKYNPPLPDADFFVACPLARGDMAYQGIAEKDVFDVLAEVEKHYSIDTDRVYLTGIGMGGGEALRLA